MSGQTPPPPPPPPPPPASNPYFPHGPSPYDAPYGAATPELARDREWQRLDPRMLLVHPVREVLRFLPVLLGLFLAGSAGGGPPLHYLGVLIPIVLG
ncbi:MAG: hypothetical protein OSB43_20215, partial [Nocardioides sp.]|nr:hypothetical protein [Nocardioides sp.]